MMIYERGISLLASKCYSEAFETFKQGARECVKCQQMLGVCYVFGYGVKKDMEQALHLFSSNYAGLLRLAHSNDPSAQLLLGNYFYHPEFRAQDVKRAVCWYEASAQNGNECAKFNLANCLFLGTGVETNQPLALKLLSEILDSGRVEVIYNYACFLESTQQHTAVKLYEMGAKKGCVRCMYALGTAYINGIGVRVNIDEGVKWLREAGKTDFYPALILLSNYDEFEPVEKPTLTEAEVEAERRAQNKKKRANTTVK